MIAAKCTGFDVLTFRRFEVYESPYVTFVSTPPA
jgi:hypothetical protein